jgi:hypothetical protein
MSKQKEASKKQKETVKKDRPTPSAAAPAKTSYEDDQRVVVKLVDDPQPRLRQQMRDIRKKRWEHLQDGMTLAQVYKTTPDGNGKNAIDEVKWLANKQHGCVAILPPGTDVAKFKRELAKEVKGGGGSKPVPSKAKTLAEAENKA